MASPIVTDGSECSCSGDIPAKCLTYCAGTDGNGGDIKLMDSVQKIINTVIGVVGVVAVAMIIIGGIQYTTSSGDAPKVKKAKDTILYGIVGLIIALLAFAIVNFVLGGMFSAGE